MLLWVLMSLLSGNVFAQKPIIAGIEFTYQSGMIVLLNAGEEPINLLGYSLSVKKRPIEILAHTIQDSALLAPDEFRRIEVDFLDFPYKRNTEKLKFKRYYLFSPGGEIVSAFKASK